MKAIFYSVAIVVAIGAAVLTFRFSSKFEELQKVRLATIAENKTVTADAAATETTLKHESEVLATSEQQREEATQRVTVLEATGSRLKTESADWDAKLKTQAEQLAEVKKAMDTVNEILKEMGGDVTLENLGDKVAEVEADKKAKQAKLEETETLINGAEKTLASNRAENDRLTKRLIERSARIGRNAMEAVVTAVDQDWGFLVIGAGSNSGFTPQTSLLVMRDGRLIGRVRPSSIEPNQTIAEIDFKSMASGARILPGDRVLLSKPNAN